MTRRIGKESDSEKVLEHVVDFNQVREQRLSAKRRTTERIFFKNLMAVYTVVGMNQLCAVELVDVSEEGCSFQVPSVDKEVEGTAILDGPSSMLELLKIKSSDVPLRFYFSQNTYMEIHAKIHNSSYSIENGEKWIRFGCSIDKTLKSYVAYQQFVRFLKSYAEHAYKEGSKSINYL